jgi:polyisoprenoid-binding protein YceI
MRGVGKHEGTIEIKKGYFITNSNQLIGGHFIINMTTITVTDIPEHEPVPLKNLTNHLKGVDFFDVGHFPTATFEITAIKKKVSDRLKVSGNLTIKGVTKTITFDALYTDAIFSTTFTINRFQWNITYEGNLIDKTLVDKDIELTIRLKT